MSLASKPWRVDFYMHITGDFWMSEYYRTKSGASETTHRVNTDETSIVWANPPYVDHVSSRLEERAILRSEIEWMEENRIVRL